MDIRLGFSKRHKYLLVGILMAFSKLANVLHEFGRNLSKCIHIHVSKIEIEDELRKLVLYH
jgi:hypothetical protein